MQTLICGKPAEWTPEIWAKWEANKADYLAQNPHATIVERRVNYFTPRPYRNEYDHGSREEGFVFTRTDLTSMFLGDVVMSVINTLPEVPRAEDEEGEAQEEGAAPAEEESGAKSQA